MSKQEILVLDFGSQYNQLIARRIRDLGVYSELVSFDISVEEIKSRNVMGIVLSGGPNSVYDEKSFRCDPKILELGIPVLGICYGMQYLSHVSGGKVVPSSNREYGGKEITFKDGVLFKGLPETWQVWMSHGDSVVELPEGYEVLASTEDCPIVSFQNLEKRLFGVQFHPEVNDSIYGKELIRNFIYDVCGCDNTWNMDSYIQEKIAEIQETVGNKRVLLGVSGGVDSTVAAVLINKAIGSQLTCMFIDHGLLRKDEAKIVMERFNRFNINVVPIDASELFLGRLAGVDEPEKKRKIIGNTFVDVFDAESSKLGEFDFLGQGTLYTDVIESGTKTAQTIKSHHNVGGLPAYMRLKLLEPLNKLFKDEVRELGRRLGIDEELVARQPFPGPGIAIRIIGDITKEKIKLVQDSDLILREEIKRAGLETKIWQYFTVLTNVRSVGVMGDKRTYMYTLALRLVNSIDGMSADYYKLSYDVIDIISRRIVNEVKGINRVVLDVTSKPPATIEWE